MAGDLESGRDAYGRGAWTDAFDSLTRAHAAGALGAADVEHLSTAAYMLGKEAECLSLLERAHHEYLDAGQALHAAHCAIWVGLHSASAGEMAPAMGWIGRARRLVEREGGDCVEQGYLLLPLLFEYEASGDFEAGAAVGAEAMAIAERFGDRDLFGIAAHYRGHLLIKQGLVSEGVALLDECMAAVTTGDMGPIVSGIVYCGVILACLDAYDVGRAREWTEALSRWCERQPDLVAYNGRCHVHRAEIMQLRGDWPEALDEAERASERCELADNRRAVGEAAYVGGDVHRLRGEFEAAEEAYREASRCGREPQPGLALLRLAQGDGQAAVAAIRRVLGETEEPFDRARLLPAHVEIMLAAGDLEAARLGSDELGQVRDSIGGELLEAQTAHASGAVQLAEGDATPALVALRRAAKGWQELEAPYEAARTRRLIGLACRRLGDHEAASLEIGGARDGFAALEAAPDLARTEQLGDPGAADSHGLTARELQVLRLVAAGRTNKLIAAELVVSERTVDRHVSNIFSKLRVSSRSAATAYAYQHKLV